jgi:hypothetical protein
MAPATPAQALRKLGILIAAFSAGGLCCCQRDGRAKSGAEVQAMVEKLYQTPEPLARRTREILGTE